MPLPQPAPRATHPWPTPFPGMVVIQCTEQGQERSITVGRVQTVIPTYVFDKAGKVTEVLKWEAYILSKHNMSKLIGQGDTWTPGAGQWHPPSEEERTWPVVREALIASGEIREASAPAPTTALDEKLAALARRVLALEEAEDEPAAPAASPGPRPRGAQPAR